jgi:hypothetical protein
MKPFREMTKAEQIAARIARNREIEQRASATVVTRMDLDSIVARLHAKRQRASYGAVAALVGVLPRGLMQGRPKNHEFSWVVAASGERRGWPTDYREDQIHPECLRQIRSGHNNVIEDTDSLRRWLREGAR